MKVRRDSVSGYVVQGAALGVGAAIGVALVTLFVEVLGPRLPFVQRLLPKGAP
jgi:hypothetical protein